MQHCFRAKIFLILLIVNPYFLKAQETIFVHGITVVENSRNQPIDFVNIGLIGRSIGTVSDERGNFFIQIPINYLDDSLTFSRVGFHSEKHRIRDLSISTFLFL